MKKQDLQQQLSVLKEVAKSYHGRTIENIIQNLEARIKENDEISLRDTPYWCTKTSEEFGITRGKIYYLRRNGDRYVIYGAKVMHGMVTIGAKYLDDYFERIYVSE